MIVLRSCFAACAAAFAFSTSAAQAAPPSWYHYVWEIPVIKGEYMPTDGGTLGTLGLTYTDDARHTFGVTTSYFDTAGHAVTDATSGVITLNDDDAVRRTGVIATTPITFFHMADGPCRGCAPRERTQTQTADTGKFEWTGPRSGRYTLNGQTQAMVEAVSGPPLVAATDFSGRWLLAIRDDQARAVTPDDVAHHEAISFVDLAPVTEARTYEVVTSPSEGLPAHGSVALPPPGARLYDVTCVGAVTASPASPCRLNWLGYNSSTEFTLWFGDDNVGHFLGVKREGDHRVVFDYGFEYPRVYGVGDKIVGRRGSPAALAEVIYRLTEFALFRAGTETSAGGGWSPK